MEATWKGKRIVYDIDTNTYSDNFTTSFMRELAIADQFTIKDVNGNGKDYITAYCKQVFNEWKDNVRYYTDFVMCLNHRACYYSNKNTKLCRLYCDLYDMYDKKAFKLFKGEDLQYYIGILD